MSGWLGTALCILPKDHEGSCDGGEIERLLGQAFAAQMAEKEWEYDR